MKKNTLLFLFIAFAMQSFAQTTSYKAVLSDDSGAILVDQPLTVRFTIFDDDPDGPGIQVFQETHTTTTNANGIIVLDLGAENLGDWYSINWGASLHYLKTEYNIGAGFVDMGSKEFHFVPYALFAFEADYIDFDYVGNKPNTLAGYGITDAFDGDYNSLSNAPTNVSSFINDVDYLTIATLPDQSDGDWYIANSSNIPTSTNDHITHLGQINVGNNSLDLACKILVQTNASDRIALKTLNPPYVTSGTATAIENRSNADGTLKFTGMLNNIYGASSGVQVGVFNSIDNTGNGVHYGTKNELSGSGSGIKYGVYSSIDQNAGGQHYAIYAEAEKANSYAGFFVGKTEFYGSMQVAPTTAGNPAIININNSGGDADLFINSSSSHLPTVTFRTNNIYRASVGYSTTEDALFFYHGVNVFFKDGNILPQQHITRNIGADERAWNKVYAHDYITQGSAAYTDRSVTTELLAHPPIAKKDGDFDAKSNGLYELDPNSLPKALHTENGLLVDEIATYNYKANFEQQIQIKELKEMVKQQNLLIQKLVKEIQKIKYK